MPSKLTQAEKHRRAGVREALREVNWLIVTRKTDNFLLPLCAAESAIRALLAPKPQPKSRRIRSYKKRGKGARK